MRVRLHATQLDRDAAEFAASLGESKKRRASSSRSAAKKTISELDDLEKNGWRGTQPRHLVAQYVRLHEHVYGAPPLELFDGKTWQAAVSATAKLVRDEFEGDAERALDFLRWTWTRERAAEKRRRKNGDTEVRRVGWRLQFATRHLMTDYRIAKARDLERGKGR